MEIVKQSGRTFDSRRVIVVKAVSMCARFEPQQHFQVQKRCGCSLVGVGVGNVAVARVLGMSGLEILPWLYLI